jgi:hypothetical protein
MGLLLELCLVALAIGAVVLFGARGLRGGTSHRDALVARRVAAYMQTIRREGRNPDLVAMSDSELEDLLLSAARNLRIETERKTYALVVAGLVTVVAAIVAATQDGLRGLGLALFAGAVVTYGLNEYLVRRIREPLARQGLDSERLRVE